MIHNEKIDKQFIKNVFDYYENNNVKHKKDLKRPWKPIKYKFDLEDSEWFHVMLDYERKHYDAGLSMSDIERLERKYRFCSMGIIENGISLVLQKSRWNTCDDCDRIICKSNPFDGYTTWYVEGKIFDSGNHKHKMLCPKCYKKRMKNV